MNCKPILIPISNTCSESKLLCHLAEKNTVFQAAMVLEINSETVYKEKAGNIKDTEAGSNGKNIASEFLFLFFSSLFHKRTSC